MPQFKLVGIASNEKDLFDIYNDLCIDLKLDKVAMDKKYAKGGKVDHNKLIRFCQVNELEVSFNFKEDEISVIYEAEYLEKEEKKDKPKKESPKPEEPEDEDPF